MEIVCDANGCKYYSEGIFFNNCSRPAHPDLEDFDILTIGEQGRCVNYTPKGEEEKSNGRQ